MDAKEILNFCLENGLLIDNEVLNLFTGNTDVESAKFILEKVKTHTNQRIITKNVFFQNKERVNEFLSDLPEEKQKNLSKLKIKLGLSIEISKEVEVSENETKERDSNLSGRKNYRGNVKVVSMLPTLSKKFEVKDFVGYFRNRFDEMKNFLQERPEMENLVSINKIQGNRQGVSIAGIVLDKKVTKNNNLLLEIEDLTGKIRVLITRNREDVYEKAEDICLDSIVGFKGSGNGEIFFANDVFFPETMLPSRKNAEVEEYALFISDIHVGSKLFFEKDFLNFISYLNCEVPNTPEAEKIKYLFLVGDLVAGVGVYPNQERELLIPDIEGQYMKMAEYLDKIRKDIQIIIIPGNHDCVRLAEPQPVLDEKYAWPLYNLENVILAQNPSTINIGSTENFSGFDVLMYHGFSFFYYANSIPKLIKQNSANSPDKIMQYLLQNRHLAPTHSSVQYSPAEKDPLLIRKAPDIFVSGHTHKSAISYYNNVLVISSSSWEDLTPIQEKFGSKPDFCKVPMFNLKTRQVKILDFEDEEHKLKMREKGIH